MAQYSSEIYLEISPRSPTAPHRWPPESEEHHGRTPEFYGFVAWTSTYLLFVIYILWVISGVTQPLIQLLYVMNTY
ncbi:hypothetical protein BYT27DRAFT_7079241 [Phlegmacium glaucopus]|nr:hypothetical protein BYT27DRAFT_7079241 [Phlegmacium glaucopus]